MRVVDARERRVLDEARETVWRSGLEGLVLVGMAGAAAVMASGWLWSLVGLPVAVLPLLWLLVGVLGADALSLLRASARARRELGRLRRDPVFLDAMVAVDLAMQRADELPRYPRGRS